MMKPGKGIATSAMNNGMTHGRHPWAHLPRYHRHKKGTSQAVTPWQKRAVSGRSPTNSATAERSTTAPMGDHHPSEEVSAKGSQVYGIAHPSVTQMEEKSRPPFPGHELQRAAQGWAGHGGHDTKKKTVSQGKRNRRK